MTPQAHRAFLDGCSHLMEIAGSEALVLTKFAKIMSVLLDLPLRATFSPAHPLARRDVPVGG